MKQPKYFAPRLARPAGWMGQRRVVGAVMATVALAAACSGGGSGSPSASGSGAPQECASLSVALNQAFPSLNPISDPGTVVGSFVFETLYRVVPSSEEPEIVPELATDMPEQVTPTSYRVTLREGVTFHDGGPLTAEDVVFTWQQTMDLANESPYATSLEFIENVRAAGPLELEFDLAAPTSLLAGRLAVMSIASKAAFTSSPESQDLQPVGSGPYRVVSAATGEQAALQRFDGYTGTREFSYDELVMHVVPDDNARLAGLRTGQYAIARSVPGTAYSQLEGEEGIEIASVPGAFDLMLMFRTDRPPFDDVRARQAVMNAIDRDAIVETVFFGHAQPAWTDAIAPTLAGSIDAEPAYSFDAARAEELLAEAGLGDSPIPIDLLVTDLFGIPQQAPIVEENLRAVGFEPSMIPGDIQAHASRAAAGEYNLWLTAGGVGVGAPDAEWVMRILYSGVFVPNQAAWDNAELGGLIDEAFQAPDVAARDEALAEAQNLIQAEAPLVPLIFTNEITAWSDSLQGYEPRSGDPYLSLEGVTGGC